MKLVAYNRLRPGAAHLVKETAGGGGNFSKTLCGRRYPGVLGKITIFSDDLHLCGVCEIVIKSRSRDG